jgi:hypothetical protein
MSPGWEYQSIPIDFDVWKALTALLTSPDDTFNDALRRKLELGPASRRSPVSSGGTRPWVDEGVTLPHGTELRRRYNGKMYLARIENGAILYDGKRYQSPSPAAIAVTGSSTNGWLFWECREPGESDWMRLDSLRDTSRIR